MKTVEQVRQDIASCMGISTLMLVFWLTAAYATCYDVTFSPAAIVVSSLVVALLVAFIVFCAVKYTEVALHQFEDYPMCPLQDMILDGANEGEEL